MAFVVVLKNGDASAAGNYADPPSQFNSAEAGCDGTDSETVWAEDFASRAGSPRVFTGEWYAIDGDESAILPGGLLANSKNWGGNVFVTIENRAMKSNSDIPGLTPFGDFVGWTGLGLGEEPDESMMNALRNIHVTGAAEYQHIRFRMYVRPADGTLFGQQKLVAFNHANDGGGIYWGGFNWRGAQAGWGDNENAPFKFFPIEGIGGFSGTEVDDDYVFPYDRWTCFETEIKLNTVGNSDGIFRVWLDDCGTTGIPAGGLGASQTLRYEDTAANWGKTAGNGGIGEIWVEGFGQPGLDGQLFYAAMRCKVNPTSACGFADPTDWD